MPALAPGGPDGPVTPVAPTTPEAPLAPPGPAAPEAPEAPAGPVTPIAPTGPVAPSGPGSFSGSPRLQIPPSGVYRTSDIYLYFSNKVYLNKKNLNSFRAFLCFE